jgi:hypothetical protein
VDPKTPLTVADAAAKSGLALRDAESGLKWLSSEYRGQLRVTSEGELVHVFPTGFSKPWEVREAWQAVLGTLGHGAMSVLRFVVRAWVAIALVGYALLFLALIIGGTFARQGGDSRRDSGGLLGGELAYGLLRVLGDALFWTFHPWSPFSAYYAPAADGWGVPRAARAGRPRVPLYERVNRFFFGPPALPEDARENERLVLAAIRAGKGRIGLADVMRVTGLPREKADPMMARLMLDYEGDVDVSDDGGIVYRFAALRKTASETATTEPPPPAWTRVKALPPLTGNSVGTNLAILALNAFNLLMASSALDNGLTLEKVGHMFERVPTPVLDTGTPIVLGVIPFAFSLLLFAVPLARALARPSRERAAATERGRLAVLREVLDHLGRKEPVLDRDVAAAWRRATGRPPDRKRIDRELVALGGDVSLESEAQVRWRFKDLELEAAAVQAEREAASEQEAQLGKVVYATDEN